MFAFCQAQYLLRGPGLNQCRMEISTRRVVICCLPHIESVQTCQGWACRVFSAEVNYSIGLCPRNKTACCIYPFPSLELLRTFQRTLILDPILDKLALCATRASINIKHINIRPTISDVCSHVFCQIDTRRFFVDSYSPFSILGVLFIFRKSSTKMRNFIDAA